MYSNITQKFYWEKLEDLTMKIRKNGRLNIMNINHTLSFVHPNDEYSVINVTYFGNV